MEDYRLDIMIDQVRTRAAVRLSLPKFTLVGATTRAGLLTAPLRSRFTLQTRLDYYDAATLLGIVRRSCHLLKVSSTTTAPAKSPLAPGGHAPHRQQSHLFHPRLRAGKSPGPDHAARRRGRAGDARDRRARPR